MEHICARCGHPQEEHRTASTPYQPCDHYIIRNGLREYCICYAYEESKPWLIALPTKDICDRCGIAHSPNSDCY
jgi:ribosomal protein L37E